MSNFFAYLKRNYGILGLILFFGAGFSNYYFRGGKLRRLHRYTIAEVYDTAWMLKSGKNAYCRYFVRGKSYVVHANADRLAGQSLIGRRFVVEFHPPEPNIAELYLTAPVPDDVLAAPAEGWETPPFSVPAEVLKH